MQTHPGPALSSMRANPGVACIILTCSVLVAACTNLPAISDTGCGNLILNDNEDCDGFSAFDGALCGEPGTANACFYVCGQEEEEKSVCPSGWACGADQRCRMPAGEFEPTGEAFRFTSREFALGDVDGDGNLDIIGNRGSLVSTRFGSGDSKFSSEEDILVPQSQGTTAFGYLNNDALLDVIVPISGGLFTLLGQDGGVEPIAYSTLPIPDMGGAVRILPVNAFSGQLMDGSIDRDSEILALFSEGMAFFEAGLDATPLPYPGANNLSSLGNHIAVGDVDGDPDGLSEIALVFDTTDKVYICGANPVDMQDNIWPNCTFQAVQTTGMTFSNGTRFADVDGDGDRDLLVGTNAVDSMSNMPFNIEVALNTGGTVQSGALFEAQSRPICLPTMSMMMQGGCAPWPLATGDFNRDGMADYVFPRAIGVASVVPALPDPSLPNTLDMVAQAGSASWSDAVVVDINGDSWDDVAVSFSGVGGIDIYINASASAGTTVFNKFHIDTDYPPVGLRSGDFDGDLIADIAFRENISYIEEDIISVIFGSSAQGPSEAVAMARFDNVEVLEPLLASARVPTDDFITDLLVISVNDRDMRTAALLQGDSSRRMLAPFFLGLSEGPPDNAREAIIGNFDSMFVDENEAQINDVIAIASEQLGPGDTSDPVSRAWLVHGIDGEGDLSVYDVPNVTLPADDQFNPTCALWVAGDLDSGSGNGLDEVIVMDNTTRCPAPATGAPPAGRMVIGRMSDGGLDPMGQSGIIQLPGDYTTARNARLHDMDADGDLDLLVVFAGDLRSSSPGGLNAGAGVVVFWNEGGVFSTSIDKIGAISFAYQPAFYDAAPIQADDDPALEIVILVQGGVYLADWQDTGQYAEPRWLFGQEGNGYVQIGDVNSDGLEDIVYTVTSYARVALQSAAEPRGETFSETGDQP